MSLKTVKYLKKYKIYFVLLIFLGFCLFILCFFFDFMNFFVLCDLSDTEFISLIKKMAIKNHNDPALYKKALSEALTEDAQIKIKVTDKFYECVYRNQTAIQTKSDLNTICGYLVYFK